MADEKAPRCDGFPFEFYKVLWEDIGPDSLHIYHKAYISKSLGNIINKGNIKFVRIFLREK